MRARDPSPALWRDVHTLRADGDRVELAIHVGGIVTGLLEAETAGYAVRLWLRSYPQGL